MTRNSRLLLASAVLPTIILACASSGGGRLARGPSGSAVTADFGAPPDSVMQTAWEVLRNDGVMARSFQRMAGDTTNLARMESDWIHVPSVYPAAPLSGVSLGEQYVKMLMWAEPYRGGTRLYVEALYDPTSASIPSEPANWARLRSIPTAHPSWSYVEEVGREIARRMNEG